MSEKKIRITKTQRFEDIKALLNGEPVEHGTTVEIACEVIDHEIGLITRKNSSDSKKQTAVQKENEGYKELILAFLADKPDGATCTEILKGIPELSEYSNQKISALVRQLKNAEPPKVVSKEGKGGKTLFSLA